MKILSIETSSPCCSVALALDEHIVEMQSHTPKEHTQQLLPMIDNLLAKQELSLADLDAIAYGQGPGSFTGLRISASVVQSLAFAHNMPVIAISSLQALAEQALRRWGTQHCIACIDARMSEVYWGEYKLHDNHMIPVTTEKVIKVADMTMPEDPYCLGIGNGWGLYKTPTQNILQIDAYPLALDVARLAQIAYAKGDFKSAAEAFPVYLSEVNFKKKG